MLTARELTREEISRIWDIDRREVIENIYYFEDGGLVLKPEHYDMQGWPSGEAELYTPILLDCFDRGGWLYGLCDDDRLIAAAVLESRFIGPRKDLLQLKQLHVSSAYRDQGLGRQLFELAKAQARARGAKGLYISATPSEHTINFYLRLGCTPTACPDPELFALEPEDIHLEYLFE
jgi:predicted N-acetyltransferase YhbS